MRDRNLKEFLSYANSNITSEHDKLLAPDFSAVHRQGSRGEYGREGGVGAGGRGLGVRVSGVTLRKDLLRGRTRCKKPKANKI